MLFWGFVLILIGATSPFFIAESFGREIPIHAVKTPSVAYAPSPAKLPPSKPLQRTSGKHTESSPRVLSDFAPNKLKDRFRKIAANHEGRYGVAVFDPVSGKTAKMGADELFFAASIGKLPALISLFKGADRGEVDLNQKISILPSDYQVGSGVLQNYPVGTTMSLEKCAFYLVNQSDNTAWAMLTRYLGTKYIQSETDKIGANSTQYWDPNTTTPDDVLLMLRHIGDASFTSEKSSEEMLDFMTNTSLEDRIPAGIPARAHVRVAHKYGSYGTSFGDAGVVFYKKDHLKHRYYIVVLSDGTDEAEARDAIQHFARATHEAISRSISINSSTNRKDSQSKRAG